ncbi:MAG TPA: TlpA disulfide reductase family protein [Candidatus Bathyarchaeia archaeon]|nr:TlpA disulfide reductase family protein [Candidatus Bathyarchaeia archaeon]
MSSKKSKEKTRAIDNAQRKHGLSRAEKIAIPIIIIIAVWVVYSVSQPAVPVQPSQSQTKTTAVLTSNPLDFTLPVIGPNGQTGQSITLSSLRGKVVFIEFMEPWCEHCQNMAPIMESVYKQYGGNVTFISVSGSWQGATIADTSTFIRTYGSSWTYVYDSSGSVMNTYGVDSTPTFVIIGRDGSVITKLVGEQSRPTLVDAITRAVAVR